MPLLCSAVYLRFNSASACTVCCSSALAGGYWVTLGREPWRRTRPVDSKVRDFLQPKAKLSARGCRQQQITAQKTQQINRAENLAAQAHASFERFEIGRLDVANHSERTSLLIPLQCAVHANYIQTLAPILRLGQPLVHVDVARIEIDQEIRGINPGLLV